MNEKDFEKINIKMQISAWASTSVTNFSQAKKFRFWEQCLKKNMNQKKI